MPPITATRPAPSTDPPTPPSGPPPSASAYSHPPRVSRTGIMERSVAAAVISAARQRTLSRKPRPPNPPPPATPASPSLPLHHRTHGRFHNPWPSAQPPQPTTRSRTGTIPASATSLAVGARSTFFHKVGKDRRPPPEEEVAGLCLLASKPRFEDAVEALEKDRAACVSYWLGHATFLMMVSGLTVLTDPVWSPRLGPLGSKRWVPAVCDIDQLPSVDVVLLSGSGYDSFDKVAVGMLKDKVGVWLCPLGVKALVVAAGIDEKKVVELDWWGEWEVKAVKVVCTPCQGASHREDTLWCSWVVNARQHRFFFCGGTGYRSVLREMEDSDNWEYRRKFGGPACPVFKEIARKFGRFDTAFLPIGGFKPRVVMSTVQGDAMDMLFVHKDLKARRSVMHRWGTFANNDEGMLDAVRALENALLNSPVAEHEVSYVRHGKLHIT